MDRVTQKQCTVGGCTNKYNGKTARGLCPPHYRLLLKDPRYKPDRPRCSVNGCNKFMIARGYCSLHWNRWVRNGDPGQADLLVEKHGHNNTRAYRAWHEMKRRCNDPKRDNYRNYGARGITYCKRWESFTRFLEDMGECPEGLTLDRIVGNKNYEPGNRRWATRRQQTLNRRAWGVSRFRGVQKSRRTWRAGIAPRKGVFINLGNYENEFEAAIAWNLAAVCFYGKDANLNIIPMLPAHIEKRASL